MDKIQLKGMIFYGYHGVLPEEQTLGQRFVVDVEIHRELRSAGLSDDLDATVNYVEVYDVVKKIVEGPPRKLIEVVAEEVAQKILDDYDIEAVSVKVKKPEVPIRGSILGYASVEIFREKP